jgi:phosphatidylinositol alpha-1,6-mannosyltransferase
MRVLVLTTEAFGGHGGIAQYNRDLLTALCAIPECERVIGLPRLMSRVPEPLPAKLIYRDDGLKGKWAYTLAAWRAARSCCDLVICGHINLLPVAVMAAWRSAAPLVLLIYGIDAWQPHRGRLVNRLLRRVAHVISISEITRDKFSSWSGIPRECIHVLPNAIDLSRYGAGPKNPILEQRYGLAGRRVLMTLGRLSADERYKGFDEVLESMPALLNLYPDLTYLIAGDGDDRDRLQRKAQSLGVADRVVFAGYVAELEKADYYRLADAYVMPGRGEGFGFVFLEAMACGVPVVASRLDGSREAVRHGELGILVDPNNREELRAGIVTALTQPKQIPPGIEYFAYPNFQQRLWVIVNDIVTKGHTIQ